VWLQVSRKLSHNYFVRVSSLEKGEFEIGRIKIWAWGFSPDPSFPYFSLGCVNPYDLRVWAGPSLSKIEMVRPGKMVKGGPEGNKKTDEKKFCKVGHSVNTFVEKGQKKLSGKKRADHCGKISQRVVLI